MNSHKNAADDWFDKIPDEKDKKEFRHQMLCCLRDHLIPEYKPDPIGDTVYEILLKIPN